MRGTDINPRTLLAKPGNDLGLVTGNWLLAGALRAACSQAAESGAAPGGGTRPPEAGIVNSDGSEAEGSPTSSLPAPLDLHPDVAYATSGCKRGVKQWVSGTLLQRHVAYATRRCKRRPKRTARRIGAPAPARACWEDQWTIPATGNWQLATTGDRRPATGDWRLATPPPHAAISWARWQVHSGVCGVVGV